MAAMPLNQQDFKCSHLSEIMSHLILMLTLAHSLAQLPHSIFTYPHYFLSTL